MGNYLEFLGMGLVKYLWQLSCGLEGLTVIIAEM